MSFVGLSGYECSVGLTYDGTPIDLQAQLNLNGVSFQYLDTSSGETEFDIFLGSYNYNTTISHKKFIVGIPYPSVGCGRVSSHISFTDGNSYKNVGSVLEYGVRALQSVNGQPSTVTNASISFVSNSFSRASFWYCSN